jgi:hypothetical protein
MKGYIYEIVSPHFEKRYIGCCIQNSRGRDTLKERFHHHKGKHNGTTSKLVIEKGDAEIRLIECCDVEDMTELRKRERQYISSRSCELVNIMSRYESVTIGKQTYMSEHKEDKKKYDLDYRAANQEKLCQRIDCECGGSYLLKHKSTHFKTNLHLNHKKL